MPLDEIVKEGEVEICFGLNGEKKIVYSTLLKKYESYSTTEIVRVRELADRIEVTYHITGRKPGASIPSMEEKVDSYVNDGVTVRIKRMQSHIFEK